jgi:hypothetical protein
VRQFAEFFIKALKWGLFIVAVGLLAFQTWLALQGKQPEYDAELSAGIVAGMVTLTWTGYLAGLLLGLEETRADWYTALGLVIVGIALDVGAALSVLMDFRFPPRLPLIVIVAQAVAHAVQAIVRVAAQAHASGLLGGAYVPPEQRIALLEQSLSTAEQRASRAEAALEHTKEKQKQSYTEYCPHCAAPFTHSTRESAERAVRAHIPLCKSRQPGSDGRQAVESVQQ